MSAANNIEYRILRYVPDMTSNDSISLAVIFTDAYDQQDGVCAMNVAVFWQAEIQQIDPDCDLKVIQALLREIQDRLLSRSERLDMIRQLDDSFSNLVQVSDKHKLPSESGLESLEELAYELLESTSPTPESSVRLAA